MCPMGTGSAVPLGAGCVCVLLARCLPCPLWVCGTWQQKVRVPLPPFSPCPGSLQTAGNIKRSLSAVIPRCIPSPFPNFLVGSCF